MSTTVRPAGMNSNGAKIKAGKVSFKELTSRIAAPPADEEGEPIRWTGRESGMASASFASRTWRQTRRRKSKQWGEESMNNPVNVVSIRPYFRVRPGKIAETKAMLPAFVARTSTERLNLHNDFTINGDEIHCRESYAGAEGILAHVENVGALLGESLKIADLTRLQIHGPVDGLSKLKSPLAHLRPTWFVYECGVKR